MIPISKSTQFNGSFDGIHFRFIQFLYLYIHIPGSSCCEVGFGQYHMILMEPDVYETFFLLDTRLKKNGMPDSLSLVLLFIATKCLTCTSLNRSNSRNESSRSTFVKVRTSLVIRRCFFGGFKVVFCGFPFLGPKYLLSSMGGRSKIVDPIPTVSAFDGNG